MLESLLRGADGVLLLDEPDNYLDVPGKRWLEQQLAATPKTVLLVSHDRELLAACAQRIVTVEDRHVWVHGGGFSGYAQARADRISRLEELRRRWDEEHEKLQQGLESYRGTVLAVTHDRWFARSFERFLIFTSDGNVREATEPAWD